VKPSLNKPHRNNINETDCMNWATALCGCECESRVEEAEHSLQPTDE